MAWSEHTVKSGQLGKQRIRECHDKSEDCLAERQTGRKDNILLRLPRIEGVKVNNIHILIQENNEKLILKLCRAHTEISNASK